MLSETQLFPKDPFQEKNKTLEKTCNLELIQSIFFIAYFCRWQPKLSSNREKSLPVQKLFGFIGNLYTNLLANIFFNNSAATKGHSLPEISPK
jgi:hypothetical protein